MNSPQKETLKIKFPVWMTWFYAMVSLWLVPWIVYLQISLPEQRISIPWRATWVIFDLALLAVSSLATYFLFRKSLWASLTLAGLAALFAADAWFDAMTSSLASDKMLTIMLDVCVEVPLAVVSLWCAVYILRRAMRAK